jgi:ankyrin repeat protein
MEAMVIVLCVTSAPAMASSVELAIAMGDVEKAGKLLDENPELLKETIGPDHKSLLAFAVGMGQPDVVRMLVARGMDPKERTAEGATLLHVAALFGGSPKIVDLLVGYGVDPNAGMTGKAAGLTALHGAAGKDNVEVAEALLDDGADPNSREDSGQTPLHIAARNGADGALKLLLKRGAKVDAVDSKGCTPLYWAAAEDQSEMVGRLLAAGANPDREINSGATALYEAAYQGHVEVVKALLAGGADVGLAKEFAQLSDHPEVVDVLENHTAGAE